MHIFLDDFGESRVVSGALIAVDDREFYTPVSG
jgi:hypothetical protein